MHTDEPCASRWLSPNLPRRNKWLYFSSEDWAEWSTAWLHRQYTGNRMSLSNGIQKHIRALKDTFIKVCETCAQKDTVSFFLRKIRQHVNPEVPTKFYRKELPQD